MGKRKTEIYEFAPSKHIFVLLQNPTTEHASSVLQSKLNTESYNFSSHSQLTVKKPVLASRQENSMLRGRLPLGCSSCASSSSSHHTMIHSILIFTLSGIPLYQKHFTSHQRHYQTASSSSASSSTSSTTGTSSTNNNQKINGANEVIAVNSTGSGNSNAASSNMTIIGSGTGNNNNGGHNSSNSTTASMISSRHLSSGEGNVGATTGDGVASTQQQQQGNVTADLPAAVAGTNNTTLPSAATTTSTTSTPKNNTTASSSSTTNTNNTPSRHHQVPSISMIQALISSMWRTAWNLPKMPGGEYLGAAASSGYGNNHNEQQQHQPSSHENLSNHNMLTHMKFNDMSITLRVSIQSELMCVIFHDDDDGVQTYEFCYLFAGEILRDFVRCVLEDQMGSNSVGDEMALLSSRSLSSAADGRRGRNSLYAAAAAVNNNRRRHSLHHHHQQQMHQEDEEDEEEELTDEDELDHQEDAEGVTTNQENNSTAPTITRTPAPNNSSKISPNLTESTTTTKTKLQISVPESLPSAKRRSLSVRTPISIKSITLEQQQRMNGRFFKICYSMRDKLIRSNLRHHVACVSCRLIDIREHSEFLNDMDEMEFDHMMKASPSMAAMESSERGMSLNGSQGSSSADAAPGVAKTRSRSKSGAEFMRQHHHTTSSFLRDTSMGGTASRTHSSGGTSLDGSTSHEDSFALSANLNILISQARDVMHEIMDDPIEIHLKTNTHTHYIAKISKHNFLVVKYRQNRSQQIQKVLEETVILLRKIHQFLSSISIQGKNS